ncbi:hypothetical protein C5167_006939 [Papaver somniferum]|uniref:Uncharacterized protein n=1 Tax=Papaver somniferum TaxID=3469 RepID=A0A4Y7JIJ9_PAPSO|nr:hypothetical protein C5167_006939 [Papaver somniferum]
MLKIILAGHGDHFVLEGFEIVVKFNGLQMQILLLNGDKNLRIISEFVEVVLVLELFLELHLMLGIALKMEVDLAINDAFSDGFGLVSVLLYKNAVDEGVNAIAERMLGLDYVATWNPAMLPSDDLTEAISTQFQTRKPTFAELRI